MDHIWVITGVGAAAAEAFVKIERDCINYSEDLCAVLGEEGELYIGYHSGRPIHGALIKEFVCDSLRGEEEEVEGEEWEESLVYTPIGDNSFSLRSRFIGVGGVVRLERHTPQDKLVGLYTSYYRRDARTGAYTKTTRAEIADDLFI
jgi:hypothetical protein